MEIYWKARPKKALQLYIIVWIISKFFICLDDKRVFMHQSWAALVCAQILFKIVNI